MRGRPCIIPGHPLTNRERVARWRAKQPKPAARPPKEDPFAELGLKTLAELLPEQPPERRRIIDVEALIA
jgi:hypothetical protein